MTIEELRQDILSFTDTEFRKLNISVDVYTDDDRGENINFSNQLIKFYLRSSTGTIAGLATSVYRLTGLITFAVFTPTTAPVTSHNQLVDKVFKMLKRYQNAILRDISIIDLGQDPERPCIYSNVQASFLIDN